jgi:hypothetical protein
MDKNGLYTLAHSIYRPLLADPGFTQGQESCG